jgi:hypothetical protein
MRRRSFLLVVLLLAACSHPALPPRPDSNGAAAVPSEPSILPSPSPTPVGAPMPIPTNTPRPLPQGASLARYPSRNQVQALAFAPDRALWAGIKNGVVRWDLVRGVPQHFPLGDDPAKSLVHDIEILSDGSIWVATGAGVSRLDAQRWVSFGAEEGLGGGVNSLAVGPDGVIWAGGEAGLARFDGTRWLAVKPHFVEANSQTIPTPDPYPPVNESVRDPAVRAGGRPVDAIQPRRVPKYTRTRRCS